MAKSVLLRVQSAAGINISKELILINECRDLGKPLFFCSRQLEVAEMDGWAGAKKSEPARKRSAGAVDKNCPKLPVQKKTQFLPSSKRTGGLTGTDKKGFPNVFFSVNTQSMSSG